MPSGPPQPARPIYRGNAPRAAKPGVQPPKRGGYRPREPFGNNAIAGQPMQRYFALPPWLARHDWPPRVRISWPDDLDEPLDLEVLDA